MRELFVYDDVEWLPGGEQTNIYGIITEIIPNQFGGSFRVQWLDGEWGYYSRKELDYICPLWEVI